MTKHNFVYNESKLWNNLIKSILDKCMPNDKNITMYLAPVKMELYAPISIVKGRLKYTF